MTSPREIRNAAKNAARRAANRRFAAVLLACLAAAFLCLALAAPPLWQSGFPKEDGTPYFPAGEDRINVNTAPAAELACLPGVGEKRARAILAYREENGPFSSAEELAEVEGLSPRMVEKFLPMICFSS